MSKRKEKEKWSLLRSEPKPTNTCINFMPIRTNQLRYISLMDDVLFTVCLFMHLPARTRCWILCVTAAARVHMKSVHQTIEYFAWCHHGMVILWKINLLASCNAKGKHYVTAMIFFLVKKDGSSITFWWKGLPKRFFQRFRINGHINFDTQIHIDRCDSDIGMK